MKRLLAVLTLIALPAFGQVTNQAARRVVKFGTAPTTCTVGDIYYKTGASAGGYLCTAANTWSAIASGGVGSSVSGSTATTPVLTVQTTDNSTAFPVLSIVDSASGNLLKVGKAGTGTATNLWVGPNAATYTQTDNWIWTDGALNFFGAKDIGATKWAAFSFYAEDNTTSAVSTIYAHNMPTITSGTKGGSNYAFNSTAELTTNGGTVSDLGALYGLCRNTSTSGVVTKCTGLSVQSSTNGGGGIGTVYGAKIENQTAGTVNYSIHTGSGLVRLGGLVVPDGSVFRVASDFTTAANTSLQTITGLTFQLPASVATTVPFRCEFTYSIATAAVAVDFGIQDATIAPTNIWAKGEMFTSATAVTAANLPTLTTTTATSVVSATPSAITTKWNARMTGMIEQPSNATASTFNIMVKTANAADLVTVHRGSYCTVGF